METRDIDPVEGRRAILPPSSRRRARLRAALKRLDDITASADKMREVLSEVYDLATTEEGGGTLVFEDHRELVALIYSTMTEWIGKKARLEEAKALVKMALE